jgi:hypothetical protein
MSDIHKKIFDAPAQSLHGEMRSERAVNVFTAVSIFDQNDQ